VQNGRKFTGRFVLTSQLTQLWANNANIARRPFHPDTSNCSDRVMTTRSPKTALVRSVKNPEITVTAIARAFSRAFPVNSVRAECLRQLLALGAAILFVSVLTASHGLDLSSGFF
jgi:hypothetical protein